MVILMNKNGFTIIEVLTAFLIVGLISGIGVVSYNFIYDITKDNYYRILKSHLLLAGNDYFENHRGEIVGSTLSVPIDRLVKGGYIDEIKDNRGNTCDNGKVIKYKGEDNKFHYELCIKCADYENYPDICE